LVCGPSAWAAFHADRSVADHAGAEAGIEDRKLARALGTSEAGGYLEDPEGYERSEKRGIMEEWRRKEALDNIRRRIRGLLNSFFFLVPVALAFAAAVKTGKGRRLAERAKRS
jgi:hypothetical protein